MVDTYTTDTCYGVPVQDQTLMIHSTVGLELISDIGGHSTTVARYEVHIQV